jgi:hypothetical protein
LNIEAGIPVHHYAALHGMTANDGAGFHAEFDEIGLTVRAAVLRLR